MKTYFLALDQGTTSSTALLLDSQKFTVVAQASHEHPQFYPTPSWVEHDLEAIWSSLMKSISLVLKKAKIKGHQIDAIGITNQRETTCAFDYEGNPISKAIVWQDRRTTPECQRLLKNKAMAKMISSKTGLPIDPYFSATKMNWLLKKFRGEYLLGTVDSFLLYRLTGGKVFATDATNASRTLLYNLKTADWDNELLKIFKVPESRLPEVRDSFSFFGHTGKIPFLPEGIPITCILGDQQAALFGQGCIHEGEMKCTYGTGSFAIMNTGEKIIKSQHGLLSTVAYRYKDQSTYALEGSCFIAGAAVQWLRDNLKLIAHSSETEELARQIKDPKLLSELFFLPFFSGLGSPYWRPEAKAAICGMTRDTSAPELTHACLEGIGFSVNDLLLSMQKDAHHRIKELKVDGGAVKNNLLMQLQASISQTKVLRPQVIETTAFGAGLGAAVGLGALELNHVSKLWKKENTFLPDKKLSLFYKVKKTKWDELIQKLYLSK